MKLTIKRWLSIPIVIAIFFAGISQISTAANSQTKQPNQPCSSPGWNFCPAKLPTGESIKLISLHRNCSQKVTAKFETRFNQKLKILFAVGIAVPGTKNNSGAGAGAQFFTNSEKFRLVATSAFSTYPKVPIPDTSLTANWMISDIYGMISQGKMDLNAVHCK